jgi:hypothetical protein
MELQLGEVAMITSVGPNPAHEAVGHTPRRRVV